MHQQPVIESDTLTTAEAIHQIAQLLLGRQGEAITPTLALERARNIVTALNGLTIGGR